LLRVNLRADPTADLDVKSGAEFVRRKLRQRRNIEAQTTEMGCKLSGRFPNIENRAGFTSCVDSSFHISDIGCVDSAAMSTSL
jgi:hypothetical protein